MIASNFRRVSLCVALACFAFSAGCESGEGSIAVNKAKKGGLWGMKIQSSAFTSGGQLPQKYTADGDNISPPLKWNTGTEHIVEYVIILQDGDAKANGDPAVHWLVYGIPAGTRELPENAAATMKLKQGVNYLGQTGYAGPKPKPGSTHKYYFQIFALNEPLQVAPGATMADLAKAYQGLVMSKGVTMVTYTGKK